MNAIIDGLEAVITVDARLEELRKQERAVIATSVEIGRAHGDELAAWKQDGIDRAMKGKAPSRPRPTAPDNAIHDAATGTLRFEIGQAIKDRQRAIAEAGDEIVGRARTVVDEQITLAAEHVARLREIEREIRDAEQAVDEITTAQAALNPSRPSLAAAKLADLDDVIAAVEHGRDLLSRHIRPEPRRLGMQNSNLHEPPRSEAPEPPLLPAPPPQTSGLVPDRVHGGFMRADRRNEL